MATVRALQHLFSSVQQGLFPERGRGFQTVAVAEELVGTEDLQALERAAFYVVSPERRASGALPVKETYFRLPSGRLAAGRTVDFGADSLGREGNYLARHLVFTEAELAAAGGNPFSLLDELAKPGEAPDLTPRRLSPLPLEVAPVADNFPHLERLTPDCRAGLAGAAAVAGERAMLLVGDEALARGVVRELFSLLPLRERLALTFSTHFYESESLRPLFRLVAAASRGEAPADREGYAFFDLAGECSPPPSGAYPGWLAACARTGRWSEVRDGNRALDGLRTGAVRSAEELFAVTGAAGCALWEREAEAMLPLLTGDADRIVRFLDRLPAPRPAADRLLALSPDALFGPGIPLETAGEALSTLKEAATPKLWRSWVRKWKKNALVEGFTRDPRPWWRKVPWVKKGG